MGAGKITVEMKSRHVCRFVAKDGSQSPSRGVAQPARQHDAASRGIAPGHRTTESGAEDHGNRFFESRETPELRPATQPLIEPRGH